MPARVVLVHDEGSHLEPMANALRGEGYEVAAFDDPLLAMNALEEARLAEVLITRIQFAPGRSNGIALARMARLRRPAIKVIFLEDGEHAALTHGLGEVFEVKEEPQEIVGIVRRFLPGVPQ